MRTIRVAHVITRLCRGGAQENTFHTVRLLRDGGRFATHDSSFTVDLISGPTSGPEGSIESKVVEAGVPILRSPHLLRPARPLHDLAALNHLTRLFRENRYDIVHTHTSKAGFLGRWAAYRAEIPIVVHTPHGHVFDGYFLRPITRAYIHLEQIAARWTDRIVALTDDEIETYLRHGIGRRDRYVVIPSGVDLAPFAEARAQREAARAQLGISPDAFLIGAVGRLEPVKGFETLIHAMPRIVDRHPDTVALIVGQGSLESSMRSQAKPLGSRIQFLGYRHDIAKVMAAFDVLAVPSVNEGMGRVVVEAGASGVPVVATSVGGLPHIVDDGRTGILVSAQDPESLAAAILRLAHDPDERRAMGRAALAKMVPAYSVETMVERIASLYLELVQAKGVAH